MTDTLLIERKAHAKEARLTHHPVVALVVEDHEHVATEVADRLSSMGHEIVVATTQQEAEVHLESTLFDYILLDLTIPSSVGARAREQNGRNLLVSIRKKPGYGGVPVIIMTAYGGDSPALAVSLMKLSATDFINKPFDDHIDSLESKIEEALLKSKQTYNGKDLKPFNGGELVFFPGRVEFHFDRFRVKVSGSRRDALMRSILELLRKNGEKSPRRPCDGKYIVQHVNTGMRGEAAIREAVYTFRSFCSKKLASHGYQCDRHDIIANENYDGYHFGPLIRLRTEVLTPEPAADGSSSKQKAIRLALNRGQMTRRQIADRIGYSVEQIATPLRILVDAGQIMRKGSGTNAMFSLISPKSQALS